MCAVAARSAFAWMPVASAGRVHRASASPNLQQLGCIRKRMQSAPVHLSKVRKFGAKLEYMDVIMNRETASGEQTSAAVRPKKVGQGNGFGIAAVTEARACEAAACWNT